MKAMRYTDLSPEQVLELTALTQEEFEYLVVRFDKEFLFHMSEWTFEGKPRANRKYSTYGNCPLPTPEDRLLFVLIHLKNHPIQAVHGQMFALPVGKTNMWIHLLTTVLSNALRNLGVVPSRSVEELRRRLSIKTDPPFSAMTGRSDRSQDPRTRKSNGSSTRERRSATR